MKKKAKRVAAAVALWVMVVACSCGAGILIGTIHLTMGWLVLAKFSGAIFLIALGWFSGEFALTEVFPKKVKDNGKLPF